jgi:hypothetical protein
MRSNTGERPAETIRSRLKESVERGIANAKLENEDFIFTHFVVDTVNFDTPSFVEIEESNVGKNIEALLDVVLENARAVDLHLEPGEVWFTNVGVSWGDRRFELFIYQG